MEAQVVEDAAAGVELCDCLPADSYILVKKLKTVGGESTITYDPFGDGADANMWATSFTTNSSNPIQKQAGF